jgi:hypothetical protein
MTMHALGILRLEEYESWMLLYRALRPILPGASLLAVLTCERRELRRRTVSRGRTRDNDVSDDYLDMLERSLRQVAQMSGSTVVEVDSSVRAPSEIADLIVSVVGLGA